VLQTRTSRPWRGFTGDAEGSRACSGTVGAAVGDCFAVELDDAIRRRHMVRSFSQDRLDPVVVDRLLQGALRSPTAGNTGGTAWVVLEGPEETGVYWDATTDQAWRDRNMARFAGLRRAPVVLLSYASPDSYAARYAEPDKLNHRLAAGDWPVPYWFGDAAFAVMSVLLGAVDAELGACVLGNFRGEEELAERLGVPEAWRLFCALPLGHPDGEDHRSASLARPRPSRSERVHRGTW